ncbi:hypothetical protein CRG49_002995 [Neisseria sp. N95_16]|uniref:Uncharacterized protein n=1 Tax=Neisseria brasiliensis TaxID=2666100 RepID=A0A7X2KYW1_9NEIS|nr:MULTISPECIES: hypothetical protein [Neisseria]MRN37635.1 hypothetical protein [Neisseria brasiliensis]PJO10317.1 hypothetical protein CRG49_002995 [Neisseria sp. N95_16]
MKAILFFLLFDISGGKLTLVEGKHLVFHSYEECQKVSKSMASSLDWKKKGYKSFSTCIPQEAFDEEPTM